MVLNSVYLYLQNALALLDLYSQVSLSLQNPTPSRLKVRNMEVDSSYSYNACKRSLLDPVCNVPVSGESRETKDWPPATLWKLIKE